MLGHLPGRVRERHQRRGDGCGEGEDRRHDPVVGERRCARNRCERRRRYAEHEIDPAPGARRHAVSERRASRLMLDAPRLRLDRRANTISTHSRPSRR